MCGKYYYFLFFSFSHLGSPPHVREVLIFSPQCLQNFRITPACAGSTYLPGTKEEAEEDHPRMCGKYLVASF